MSDPHFPFLKPDSNGNSLGQLAHFRVVRLLGEGGMGYVFEAIDERLRRTIALKVMKPQVAVGPDREARFLREAQALAAVRHPNVATIYEIGVDAGVPFLAMEKLSGQTLESRLADAKPMSVEEILSMGAEISDGLKAIHDAGIIHRDIKPANIWLENEKGIAKVIDFGLAQADDWTLRKNASGNVAGTPQYMSPEQVRGEPLTEQSDLYSLGVLLFRALSGRMPHDEPDVHRQLAAIVARAPTKLADAKKDLPIPLCRLVDRLLAKDLTSRPKSAEAVRAELIVFRNERLAFRQAGTSLNLILGKVSRFIVSPVTLTTVASILLPACVVFASAGWIWRPTIVHDKVVVTVPALTLELPSLRNVSPASRRQVEIPLTGQHGRVFGLATRQGPPFGEIGSVMVFDQPAISMKRILVIESDLRELDLSRGKCVDAFLWIAIVPPREAMKKNQRLNLYGIVPSEKFSIDTLEYNEVARWREQKNATYLNQWELTNELSQPNPAPRSIPFTSIELIQFVRAHSNERILLWLESADPANGPTHFLAQSQQVALRPKLVLTIAEIVDREAQP